MAALETLTLPMGRRIVASRAASGSSSETRLLLSAPRDAGQYQQQQKASPAKVISQRAQARDRPHVFSAAQRR